MSQVRITDSGTFEFSFEDVAAAVHEERMIGRRVLVEAIQEEIKKLDNPCQSVAKKALLRVLLRHVAELN